MTKTVFFTIERDGVEREVEVTADIQGPEPDVGIFGPCCEGVHCKDGTDLTEKEEEAVSEKLAQRYWDDVSESYEEYE